MKKIDVEYIPSLGKPGLKELNSEFLELEEHKIDILNWDDFNYKPNVSFKIFYTNYGVYIKYEVLEKQTKGLYSQVNSPVYKDSCVEFFILGDNDKYYNFEFNCIGTAYAGHGYSLDSSEVMDSSKVEEIRTFPSLGRVPFQEKKINSPWTLIVEIPITLFMKKGFEGIKGSTVRGNLYKCGDDLTVPHFLSWNPIKVSSPDFHQPDFFGYLNFK